MATINFSVPDDVKKRLNRTFAHENKSAMVTRMLQDAMARAERKAQSDARVHANFGSPATGSTCVD